MINNAKYDISITEFCIVKSRRLTDGMPYVTSALSLRKYCFLFLFTGRKKTAVVEKENTRVSFNGD